MSIGKLLEVFLASNFSDKRKQESKTRRKQKSALDRVRVTWSILRAWAGQTPGTAAVAGV